MSRDFLVRSKQCKFYDSTGINLKLIIPVKQYQSNKPSLVPNQEIQINFAENFNNEKRREIFIRR